MNLDMTWAAIDLNAIAHNVKELCKLTDSKAEFMAVVKSDAYGHGFTQVARTALKNGATKLGVARIDEGIKLRKAGFDAPVLIFGQTMPEMAQQLLDYDLTQSVYSYENAFAISQKAVSCNKKIKIHIKLDTGMGRLGLLTFSDDLDNNVEKDSFNEVKSIYNLQGLKTEGIFSHFAASDTKDKTFAKLQLKRFTNFIAQLEFSCLKFPIQHIANSAGLIEIKKSHLDMVRAGISVYGLYPSNEVDKNLVHLKPAMTLKTRIINLKKVPAGFPISYGMTYKTNSPTTIATVSIGYADGLNRLLSSQGYMLVNGKRAPIVGRVCMDLTMLDVGHISNIKINDEVVVFGSQGDETIHVDELASCLNTINYEIVSTITKRVPRVYLR